MPESTPRQVQPALGVVIPVFDDWESLRRLIPEVVQQAGKERRLYFCVVDDGSLRQMGIENLYAEGHSISLVRLSTNLGHQRAICVGLTQIAEQRTLDCVVVMDADGEDAPKAIPKLLDALGQDGPQVAVARRTTRTEKLGFRLLYRMYRLLFRVLTGNTLDFGNFSILNRLALERLIAMPELWNHYPAAVMRSGILLSRVPIARARRYFGQSKMNTPALVGHGLAGLSVFLDRVLARLIVLTLYLAAFLAAIVGVAVAVRLAWQVPAPGWFALIATVAAIGLLQLLGMLTLLAFIALAQRSRFEPAPKTFVGEYVSHVSHLEAKPVRTT